MRWNFFKSLTSFHRHKAAVAPHVSLPPALTLANLATEHIRPTDEQITSIRKAMLDCVDSVRTHDAKRPHLWARVAVTRDLQALWYLRTDVLMYLASFIGETQARVRLQPVTEMFRGLISQSQMGYQRRSSET